MQLPPSSRAQNRPLCALLAAGPPVFGLFEHKIGVFVRFCPPKAPFSGFSSTKLRFLCAFASKCFPMVVRRGSLPVVSSRWSSLMMTLAHSPSYRHPDQQYLCHGAQVPRSIIGKSLPAETDQNPHKEAVYKKPGTKKPCTRSHTQRSRAQKSREQKNRAQRKLCTEESVLETGIEPVRTFLPTGF